METSTLILIILAVVLGILYFARRNARTKKGTQTRRRL